MEALIARIEWLAAQAWVLTAEQSTWLAEKMAAFPDVVNFLSEAALTWLNGPVG